MTTPTSATIVNALVAASCITVGAIAQNSTHAEKDTDRLQCIERQAESDAIASAYAFDPYRGTSIGTIVRQREEAAATNVVASQSTIEPVSVDSFNDGGDDEPAESSRCMDIISYATTNLVENATNDLEITAFVKTDDSCDFRAQWQDDVMRAGDELGVLATTNVCFNTPGVSSLVAKTQVPESCRAVEFSLPLIALPEEWRLIGAQFKVMKLLDSDGDGIADYIEENFYHTNPYDPDSDDDGISDGDEIFLGTKPRNPDTDGDGLRDGDELQYGSNPRSMYSKGDGVIDDYSAYVLRLDPVELDTDGDGISDIDEMRGRDINNTEPLKKDTDGDGLSDGDEINVYGTNPRSVDTDYDGLTDYQEIFELWSEPDDNDSDDDGINDYQEWIIGSYPKGATTKAMLCTNITGHNYESSSGPLFEFSRNLDVNVTYTGELWDSDYAVFGLHAPYGGSTTSSALDFSNTGPNTSYHNAFVMTFANGRFRALRTGRYGFRINVDDWAKINIDGTEIFDNYYSDDGVGVPGAYVEKLMVAGCDYPVSGVVSNVGGRATLEFANHVTFEPIDHVKCEASFSKSFVMCAAHANESMTPEKHVFLRISARGGDLGGRLTFSSQGMSKLSGYGVNGLDCDSLPSYLDVAASSTVNLLVSYRGNSPSTSLDDVRLTATFVENQTGYTSVSTAAVTVVKASMYADYDRDGDIDADDKAAWARGNKLRHWVNTNDANNSTVDGVADLLDFVPVRLDIKELLELLGNNANSDYRFKIEGPNNAVNCLWTSLSPSNASSFQYEECANVGYNLSESVSSAHVAAVGQNMSGDFIEHLRSSVNGGVFLIEGKQSCYSPLVFACYRNSDSVLVARVRMPMRISNVEDFYWFHNLRCACGDLSRFAHQNAMPDNFEANESNTCLYFLHGFRVSLQGSREWFSEIFKRFWQTGAKVCFHGVTWASDQGGVDYHRNVANAFATAPALANLMNFIPGEKVVMAHSLGNMVVSSAIQDHNLHVRKYLMCNSAVPSEAYFDENDISIRTPAMVHPSWEQYPTNSWASNWHKLFADNETDGRRLLGWPGRFKNVLQYAVNFYSSGDEVLELHQDNDVWLWTGLGDLDFGHNSWHKQEMFKGRGGIGGTDWIGWSIRKNFLGMNMISSLEAQSMTCEDFKTNTVFKACPESFLNSSINREVANNHLAYGVPALSQATGNRSLVPKIVRTRNINLDSIVDGADALGASRTNGWPNNSVYNVRWLHSDIKDVPYFYNFSAYERLIQAGELR